MTEKYISIDINEIMTHLPHRYPFLLIDRVLELELNKRVKAIKNVTINEPFFVGHFAKFPVMPGVLIIESMAQAAGILAIKSLGGLSENELYFFAGIDNARFKKQVIPGDQLVIEVNVVTIKCGIGKYSAKAFVDGNVVCEAGIMCARRGV